MANPLVSVVIPAFNAERFLGKTLDSVLAQTYTNIEVIVVDDGSTDQTVAIVLDFCRRDSRVILLSQDNLGVAAARNLAIEKSRGEFIAPIDADDIWYPDKIESQMEVIQRAGPSFGLVYTWAYAIDESDRLIAAFGSRYRGDVFLETIHDSVVGTASCPLIRKSVLEKVGYYDTALRSKGVEGCEDWDLEIRLSCHCRFDHVPRYQVAHRIVPGSMSKNLGVMRDSAVAVLEKTRCAYPDLPTQLFRWRRSAIDFSSSIKYSGEADYPKAFVLFVSSLVRDPLRLFWTLSLPIRVLRRFHELPRMLGMKRFAPPGWEREAKIVKRHQMSLDKPDLFKRLNAERLSRTKDIYAQSLRDLSFRSGVLE